MTRSRKLTQVDYDAMQLLRDDGYLISEIAAKLLVNETTVRVHTVPRRVKEELQTSSVRPADRVASRFGSWCQPRWGRA